MGSNKLLDDFQCLRTSSAAGLADSHISDPVRRMPLCLLVGSRSETLFGPLIDCSFLCCSALVWGSSAKHKPQKVGRVSFRCYS